MSKRTSSPDFFASEPSLKRQRTVETKSRSPASFASCHIPSSNISIPSVSSAPPPSSSSSSSSSNDLTTPSIRFPFFSLPAEIRDEIYKHAFVPDHGVSICQCRSCRSYLSNHWQSSPWQSLLASAMRVSKQFGAEAKQAFYENASFVIYKQWDVNHSRLLNDHFRRHASPMERFDDAHTSLASEMGEDVWRDRHFALAMARASKYWDLSLIRWLYVRVISEVRPHWSNTFPEDGIEDEDEAEAEDEVEGMMGEDEWNEDEGEESDVEEEYEDDIVDQLQPEEETVETSGQEETSDEQQQQQQEPQEEEEEEEEEDASKGISREEYLRRLREDFHKNAFATPVEPVLVFTDAFPEPAGIMIDCKPDDKSKQDFERAMQLLFSGGTMDMMGLGHLAGSSDRVWLKGMKSLREVYVAFELERMSFAYGDENPQLQAFKDSEPVVLYALETIARQTFVSSSSSCSSHLESKSKSKQLTKLKFSCCYLEEMYMDRARRDRLMKQVFENIKQEG